MNKGFTLVELLAVIIILSILALITIISINPILKDSEKGLSNIQIENIKESASLYYLKHGIGIADFELDNPSDCINVTDLIESGYIEKDEVIDPKTEEKILGSVKVTYKANNYIYEYQENTCTNYDKGIICERVKNTEVGNVPEGNFIAGDAYNCKVAPDKEPYKFYVLTTPEEDSNMVNLIMDQNINSDGTPFKMSETSNNGENIYNSVEWISDIDYGCTGEDCVTTEKGPITAIRFLHNATKKWINIKPLSYTYDDLGFHETLSTTGSYTSFISKNGISVITSLSGEEVKISTQEEPLRARLPIYLAIWDDDSNKVEKGELLDLKSDSSNAYLYVNLDDNAEDPSYGYWTLSSDYLYDAWGVNYYGEVDSDAISADSYYGVRPVISVYKFQME